jgi:hypothetical protein
MVPPKLGAPFSWPIGLPLVPMMRAKPWTEPSASVTPGTEATWPMIDSGMRGRKVGPKSCSIFWLERT